MSNNKSSKRNREIKKSPRNKKKSRFYNCYDYCINSAENINSPEEDIIILETEKQPEKENIEYTIQDKEKSRNSDTFSKKIEKKTSENLIHPEKENIEYTIQDKEKSRNSVIFSKKIDKKTSENLIHRENIIKDKEIENNDTHHKIKEKIDHMNHPITEENKKIDNSEHTLDKLNIDSIIQAIENANCYKDDNKKRIEYIKKLLEENEFDIIRIH
jgi:hypothetical protein